MSETRAAPGLRRQIVVAAILLLIVAAIAVVGSLANSGNAEGWYQDVRKVPWNPPGAVFGPVWTVLYIAIAAAGFLVWRAGQRQGADRARPWLVVYGVHLALNAAWSPAFFAGYPVLGPAAWWIAAAIIVLLVIAVAWLTAAAWRYSRIATILLAPYLLWLLFASTLNIGIIALN
ncbi:TspO/MBR family protein [Microbacterium album]|uniref:Tryptophan-rich sensory protein n=1 Tax=Microbacterium album TaxID=2053191 RepID=A0A917IIR0_9MICO|nr:TspO/MBR family protein [Microbacterium album]GGH50978.1 tryptophan-rich sensory protein [Microbacterium album]